MLRKLYDWTLSLAARKSAEWWLAVIAFLESSFFPVPAEVMFVPMGIAKQERVYRYALVASVASVLGGIAGWLLGHYAYEHIARPVLEFYGSLDKFELLRSSSSKDAILLMLITSGLAHLPPMKVVSPWQLKRRASMRMRLSTPSSPIQLVIAVANQHARCGR